MVQVFVPRDVCLTTFIDRETLNVATCSTRKLLKGISYSLTKSPDSRVTCFEFDKQSQWLVHDVYTFNRKVKIK